MLFRSDDYSWERSADPYYVIGSGGKYAMGAMLANSYEFPMTAQGQCDAIESAISVAIDCDQNSGGPIQTFKQVAK